MLSFQLTWLKYTLVSWRSMSLSWCRNCCCCCHLESFGKGILNWIGRFWSDCCHSIANTTTRDWILCFKFSLSPLRFSLTKLTNIKTTTVITKVYSILASYFLHMRLNIKFDVKKQNNLQIFNWTYFLHNQFFFFFDIVKFLCWVSYI